MSSWALQIGAPISSYISVGVPRWSVVIDAYLPVSSRMTGAKDSGSQCHVTVPVGLISWRSWCPSQTYSVTLGALPSEETRFSVRRPNASYWNEMRMLSGRSTSRN